MFFRFAKTHTLPLSWGISLLVVAVASSLAVAQEDQPSAENAGKSPSGIRQLMPDFPVWIDPKRKMVIMDGEVVLRRGSLEMFACLTGTKEHESVVAIPTDAYVVHAGLLAVGAEQGRPVEFDPEYRPPTGDVIEVLVQWRDEEGKLRTRRAQDWVRDARSGKVMKYDWVFPGSYFWQDVPPEALQQQPSEEGNQPQGRMIYAAEGGELICVSNFRSSMLDLPVPSTQENSNLWFEAYTENIPPEGTKVRVFLIPKKGQKPKTDAPPEANKEAEPTQSAEKGPAEGSETDTSLEQEQSPDAAPKTETPPVDKRESPQSGPGQDS